MKYFVTAIEEEGPGVLATEIEAASFHDAIDVTLRKARDEFGDVELRITSITEEPSEPAWACRSLMMAGVVHGEHMKRRTL